jgi:hypothetical protein
MADEFTAEKFAEVCFQHGYKKEISLNKIREVLVVDFKMSRLDFPFAKHDVKKYIQRLESDGLGTYDGIMQKFIFKTELTEKPKSTEQAKLK